MTATDTLGALDAPAAALAGVLDDAFDGPVKPFLRGEWLGHAVHPLLIVVPIGTWSSALLLDVAGRDESAAAMLVGAGLAATPLVAATGWSDWHDEQADSPAVRRSGMVHAATNVAGITLQVLSLAARRRGDRGRGVALSLAAMACVGAGGWLGGHLTYVQGSRVETES